MTPAEGEAWGLQQAMIWMKMLGYHKVIFEMDCKMVVDDVLLLGVKQTKALMLLHAALSHASRYL
ncbi:hypothetical protein A2U01_0020229 [Trifolium medium]|uniref:RNase H type-1 domain-containing protein n=1 Tax=Trifolium medium TaxID=97028 RepID=A0A392NJC1_9FABA|nr:hypothetical protein [Trifolium medium]